MKDFVQLQNKVMAPSFSWHFVNGISYDQEEILGDYQFTHPITREGKLVSPVGNDFLLVAETVAKKIKTEIDSYARLMLVSSMYRKQTKRFAPHIDWIQKHKVIIYYLNTCNGNTIIYKEKYNPKVLDENKQQHSSVDYLNKVLKNKLTVAKEVQPVENRAVIFDGFHYHTGQFTTNTQRRVLVNICFI